MSALSISEIFANIHFYQEHYLSILSKPDQYYIEVPEAYIQVWPFGKQNLYLGDLLQLWFAEKWLIHSTQTTFVHNLIADQSQERVADLYLYQLHGNALTGKNQSIAWSVETHTPQVIQVQGVLQHFCEYKTLATIQSQVHSGAQIYPSVA